MTSEDTSAATGPAELIDQHRRHIDKIDKTIVALLAERLRVGQALGDIKRANAWPMRSTAREAEVLASVRRAAGGPLPPESAERIFTTIIAETTAVQGRGDE